MKPKINNDKIKGRMREFNLTQRDVAEYLDLSLPTVNSRFQNTTTWKSNELTLLCLLLNVSIDFFFD